jgi:hypothetical protein
VSSIQRRRNSESAIRIAAGTCVSVSVCSPPGLAASRPAEREKEYSPSSLRSSSKAYMGGGALSLGV